MRKIAFEFLLCNNWWCSSRRQRTLEKNESGIGQEFSFRHVDFEVLAVCGDLPSRQLSILFFSAEERHELDT